MKKSKITAIGMTLALALPSVLGMHANASESTIDLNGDGRFNLSDMVTMRQYLIGNADVKGNADVNNDGIVNVFDYIEMRKQLLENISTSVPEPSKTSRNLCAGIESSEIKGKEIDEPFIMGQTKFALDLLKAERKENENVLLSSYSIAQALGMTANGAGGQTKSEMENVIGGMPLEELNEYFYTQRTSQPHNQYCKVNTANSIWSRDTETSLINPEFIQDNVDYYNADFFSAPFDETTVDDINNWISNKTDKMINKMIEEIDDLTKMFLINAVCFDAQWEEPYSKYQIKDYDFHAADGSIQNAEMLCSTESYYIEDENAIGVVKSYMGKYAFAALLPNEDMTLDEYIDTLTPEKLNAVLSDRKNDAMVHSKIPKFKTGYSAELNDTLSELGMPTAFNYEKADFFRMRPSVPHSMYIGGVLHKTFIDLNESGTKAAAATVVIMKDNGMPYFPEKEIEITLDRPFLYCIINTETNLPLFIGTLNTLE